MFLHFQHFYFTSIFLIVNPNDERLNIAVDCNSNTRKHKKSSECNIPQGIMYRTKASVSLFLGMWEWIKLLQAIL